MNFYKRIAVAVAYDNELLGVYNNTPKYAMFAALRENLPRDELAAILETYTADVRRRAERSDG